MINIEYKIVYADDLIIIGELCDSLQFLKLQSIYIYFVS